jgi:nicotinamide mononucleotide (NMN) deamidase PncC
MEDVLGALVRQTGVTVASVENLTGGLLSQKLLSACGENFCEGVVANGESALKRLLDPSDLRLADEFDAGQNRLELTRALVRSVKSRSGADMAVAVMCFPDLAKETINLSPGETFVMVYNGREYTEHRLKFGGRGGPDQVRATMYALDTLRCYLMRAPQTHT